MQPHTQASELAALEGSQWGLVQCLQVIRVLGLSAAFSSPHWPYCLLVTRGQPSSRHLDSGRRGLAKAVDTRVDNELSMISFCVSMEAHPQWGP